MVDNSLRNTILIAAAAAVLLPAAAAQAQYYGAPAAAPPPLYPYAARNPGVIQPGQAYAVQVAPGTYVIRRPAAATRDYPYVSGSDVRRPARPRHERAPRNERVQRAQPQRAEPAARRAAPVRTTSTRNAASKNASTKNASAKDVSAKDVPSKNTRVKGEVINTTRVVREKPQVIETTRHVDLPPRVIERYNIVEADDTATSSVPPPAAEPDPIDPPQGGKGRADGKKRVIRAEAEVTILGPDRMTIQLFRRGEGPRARAN